jgi:anaerobic ribonucleoside-triphosphate reductase activating protein
LTRARVHAVLSRSRANGPGLRFVVWFQGCSLGCPGCFNPLTHQAAGGRPYEVEELVAAALAGPPAVEGVTLTGGEPLEQPGAVAELCAALRARSDLGIIILSGFSRAEIERDPARRNAVAAADVVVAGRYTAARRLASGLRGSDNKTHWFLTGRYTAADLEATPDAEVLIGPDGTMVVTGMGRP